MGCPLFGFVWCLRGLSFFRFALQISMQRCWMTFLACVTSLSPFAISRYMSLLEASKAQPFRLGKFFPGLDILIYVGFTGFQIMSLSAHCTGSFFRFFLIYIFTIDLCCQRSNKTIVIGTSGWISGLSVARSRCPWIDLCLSLAKNHWIARNICFNHYVLYELREWRERLLFVLPFVNRSAPSCERPLG
jgi:hypothetical protein